MASARWRALHRHRQLQHHPRSGRGLDQLRHLSGDDPRRQDRRLLHLPWKAWQANARQVPGARRAHAGGGGVRRRSRHLPDGLQRGALRRERVRDRRRHARQAGGRDQRPGHRPADSRQRRDRAGRLCRARQRAGRGAIRRMDRLLRQRPAAGAGARRQGGLLSQQPDPAGLPAATPARRDLPLSRGGALGAAAREHHEGRRARR